MTDCLLHLLLLTAIVLCFTCSSIYQYSTLVLYFFPAILVETSFCDFTKLVVTVDLST